MPGKILLVDSHRIVRARTRSLLEHSGWQVIGEATDGKEAVQKTRLLAPDLVILDISLPGQSGLEAAAEILSGSPRTKILVFTIHEAEEIKTEASRIGIHGYVLKDSSDTDLLSEIGRILGPPGRRT